jgi:predicted  nucleic acid-binding Zn-ribbon protein
MGWKDYLENNPLVIIASAIVIAGGIGWTVSEKIRVEPRDREITSLNKKIDDAQKNLNELNAAYDPYRKQIQQLLAEKQQLENNLTLYQTNDKGYRDIIKRWEDIHQKSNKECGDTINLRFGDF